VSIHVENPRDTKKSNNPCYFRFGLWVFLFFLLTSEGTFFTRFSPDLQVNCLSWISARRSFSYLPRQSFLWNSLWAQFLLPPPDSSEFPIKRLAVAGEAYVIGCRRTMVRPPGGSSKVSVTALISCEKTHDWQPQPLQTSFLLPPLHAQAGCSSFPYVMMKSLPSVFHGEFL